jgi:hypothetical protein
MTRRRNLYINRRPLIIVQRNRVRIIAHSFSIRRPMGIAKRNGILLMLYAIWRYTVVPLGPVRGEAIPAPGGLGSKLDLLASRRAGNAFPLADAVAVEAEEQG